MTPPTVPVTPPLVLVPVPPKPVRVVEATVLVAIVVFTALKPVNVPIPVLLPSPNPTPVEEVPSNVALVVVAVFPLNRLLPRLSPVVAADAGVAPKVKPVLCPNWLVCPNVPKVEAVAAVFAALNTEKFAVEGAPTAPNLNPEVAPVEAAVD